EQHVDHRRDVHLRRRLGNLPLEDRVRAVMLMGVGHYFLTFGSAMSAMSSMPLARSSSIASITVPYGASVSALMKTIFCDLLSSASSIFRRSSDICTCTELT